MKYNRHNTIILFLQITSTIIVLFTMLACHQSKKAGSEKNKDTLETTHTIPFESLVSKTQSGIEYDTLLLIQNEKEYKKYWEALNSNIIGDPPQPPKVDFNKSNIILLTEGMRNNGGYSVKIKNIIESTEFVEIQANFNRPGEKCMVTDVITTPFDMVVTSIINKPIQLKKSIVVHKCN